MHTVGSRVNTVATFAISILALMCFLAAWTDMLHNANPTVELDIVQVDRIQVGMRGTDEAFLTFRLSANLESLFTWNTKQLFVYVTATYESKLNQLNKVVIWDYIVEDKEEALLDLPFQRNKYRLEDQTRGLRGAQVNLTFSYNVMPVVGGLRSRELPGGSFSLPSEYS